MKMNTNGMIIKWEASDRVSPVLVEGTVIGS
jgi:hypothetical protein